MAYTTNVWKQMITNDSEVKTSLTLQGSLIGDHVHSVSLSVFSQSASIASLPLVIKFSPTPIFKDEVHEDLMQMITGSRHSSME